MANYLIEHLYTLSVESYAARELPIGAILVKDDKILAASQNWCEREGSPIEHAEIRVIREALKEHGKWKIRGSLLYTSLEPCLMCAGAVIESNLKGVVFFVESKNSTRELLESNNISSFYMADERFYTLFRSFFIEMRQQNRIDS